jgi:hypothetical protein
MLIMQKSRADKKIDTEAAQDRSESVSLMVPMRLGEDARRRGELASLFERGVLTSEDPRAPLRLAFPAELAARWMPGLFPEHAGST